MFAKLYIQFFFDVTQCSVGCIEEHVCTHIVLLPFPFFFNIFQGVSAMFRCGKYGGRKKIKNSLFPYWTEFLNPPFLEFEALRLDCSNNFGFPTTNSKMGIPYDLLCINLFYSIIFKFNVKYEKELFTFASHYDGCNDECSFCLVW